MAPWAALPSNARKGLLRLYIAVSLPWVAWFGYQVVSNADRATYSSSARQHITASVFLSLLVPIGAPILLRVVAWIVQGFVSQKSETSGGDAAGLRDKQSSIEFDIDQLRIKVAKELACRPDFAANKYLRTGWLFGKHISDWPRLDDAKLSAEQKAKLPRSYYEEGGVDPNLLAPNFGYPSGHSMVEHLIELQERIGASGDLESLVDSLVDQEIARRLRRKRQRDG